MIPATEARSKVAPVEIFAFSERSSRLHLPPTAPIKWCEAGNDQQEDHNATATITDIQTNGKKVR